MSQTPLKTFKSGGDRKNDDELLDESKIVEETGMTTESFIASLSGVKRIPEGIDLKNGKVVRETATGNKKEVMKGDKKCIELWTPGFDARFPHMNQTRRCWQSYVDYFRCTSRYGEDEKRCEYFKKVYEHLCPGFWVEEWDGMRENGTFPANLE